MKIFAYDKPLTTFINTMADLTMVNVAWLICCIPVITIGASTTAMYSVVLKMHTEERCHIFKDFFAAFKKHFKTSTCLWIITLLIGAFFVFDISFCLLNPTPALRIASYVLYACILFYSFIVVFVFPVQARYALSVKDTLIRSLFLSSQHYLNAIFLVGIMSIPSLLFYAFPDKTKVIAALLIVFGCAVIAYLQSCLLFRIFAKEDRTD